LFSGYTCEHTLPDRWLKRSPTFLKLVEMEASLGELHDKAIKGCDEEHDGARAYRQKCIENDVPCLGFFDSFYSPGHPCQLLRPE
jgi:hypothetical protein